MNHKWLFSGLWFNLLEERPFGPFEPVIGMRQEN